MKQVGQTEIINPGEETELEKVIRIWEEAQKLVDTMYDRAMFELTDDRAIHDITRMVYNFGLKSAGLEKYIKYP
jgi:hypothetical protein